MDRSSLRAYSPELLLTWRARHGDARHLALEGTLVFADVSGFTRLSERLERAGGKLGAEQMAEVISSLCGELLGVAAQHGGEMLKYGGDALLIFFTGSGHGPRAVVACHQMQRQLRRVGRIDTGAGIVRLRMSVGVHSATFHFFRVGTLHEELVIAGADTTTCVRMEAAAEAGEVLCSDATVALVGDRWFGEGREGGRLLARQPPTSPPGVPESHRAIEDRSAGEEFLAPILRSHLDQPTVEPDHRLSTIAFLHVMGVDSMLTLDGPTHTAGALHDTVACIQQAMADFDVTFQATDLAPDGVKVMAAAGCPIAVPDDAGRMLLALRQVVEAPTPLAVRCGANRGHVFSGAVGPDFRRTFTTMGDVTNTAARVMGRAGAGEVLALSSVTESAQPAFELIEQPSFTAKGKTVPLVPVLVGPRVGSSRRSIRARSTPLIGRQRELTCLQAAVDRAAEGGTDIVEVVADPGMGKSRLIAELVSSRPRLRWLHHQCDPYEVNVAFATARRLLLDALDALATDLASAVADRTPDLMPWLPLLGAPLGLSFAPTAATVGLSEAEAGAKTVQVLAELLAACATPLTIVVENVEWLDGPSREMLRRLPQLTRSGLLLCLTRRGDTAEVVAGCEIVELGPLDAESAEVMVRQLFGNQILTHELRNLVKRGQGNPFFLRELAHAARSGAALPDTLEALLATRIDQLDKEERHALRCAAVMGATVDLALLRDLIGDAADRLTETGLVYIGDDGSAHFHHALVRDVAYEGLPFRRRREMHGQIGRLIESGAQDRGEAADALSLHFLLAREGERSWRYAVSAAEHASSLAAHDIAASLYRRALDSRRFGAVPSRAELRSVWMDLGSAQFWSGDLSGAVAAYRSARRLSRDCPEELAKSQFFEGEVAERRGDLATARRWFRRALVSTAGCHSSEASKWRIRALTAIGVADLRRGQLRRAVASSEAAAREAIAAGDPAGEAHALQLHYLAALGLGLPDRRQLADRALALFASLDPPDVKEQANLLNNLGLDAQESGDLESALEFYRSSRAAQEAAGNALAAAAVDNNIGEILLATGDHEGAAKLLERAHGVFLAAGSWFAHVAAANLGTLALRGGRLAEARPQLEATLAAVTAMGLQPLIADVKRRLEELERMESSTGHRAG